MNLVKQGKIEKNRKQMRCRSWLLVKSSKTIKTYKVSIEANNNVLEQNYFKCVICFLKNSLFTQNKKIIQFFFF